MDLADAPALFPTSIGDMSNGIATGGLQTLGPRSETTMTMMGIPMFERFFRSVSSLDVDKDDLKRYDDFINDKLYDLLLAGRNRARAEGRDVINPTDLPVTKGLQEGIQQFKKIDEGIGLQPILAQIAARPPLDLTIADETQDALPDVAGGISVALARTFVLIRPDLVNPSAGDWERAFRIFDLLL